MSCLLGNNEMDNLPEGINMENAKMVELDDGIAFQSHYAFLKSIIPSPLT